MMHGYSCTVCFILHNKKNGSHELLSGDLAMKECLNVKRMSVILPFKHIDVVNCLFQDFDWRMIPAHCVNCAQLKCIVIVV